MHYITRHLSQWYSLIDIKHEHGRSRIPSNGFATDHALFCVPRMRKYNRPSVTGMQFHFALVRARLQGFVVNHIRF